ncbi:MULTISPECIES: NUDIX hydrolase [unclassified Streptomyces]|uniref:NUDIX hydrolase n=1 Tax=unclassified Streptomyces TaxID=2593676 RepID=UPI000DD946D7|nr:MULTISPECIES: NUDIX hydrolase [unclassified Streptomyces]QZZ28669.1 NUDIX hydrolase [Streptomyces sp. ST1015]
MNSEATVQAAGCVLWRTSPLSENPTREDPTAENLEVCLVHRPKYDDWSHPKGKLKRGEPPLDGALREVEEETGYTARPGARLLTLAYEVHGRPKEVQYWAAEATTGTFAPNDEVDRILWLPPTAARDRLTHPRDRDLVDALLTAIRRSTVSSA